MSSSKSMSRDERLRRVLILCCSFARNLAYYRVGRNRKYLALQSQAHNPTFTFWRAVSGNFIDTCVLEWCKLFADPRGKHHWKNVVTDPNGFSAALFRDLATDEQRFAKETEIMLRYRDKFIAHLDSDLIMNIPELGTAKKAVWFYYQYLLLNEEADSVGLPIDLNAGYLQTEDEAGRAYEKAL